MQKCAKCFDMKFIVIVDTEQRCVVCVCVGVYVC